MDLIWDKTSFSADFKKHIGFVDADIPFVRLESALRAATSEISDLISKEQYDLIKSEIEETEFSKLVKYAILLRALMLCRVTKIIIFESNSQQFRQRTAKKRCCVVSRR